MNKNLRLTFKGLIDMIVSMAYPNTQILITEKRNRFDGLSKLRTSLHYHSKRKFPQKRCEVKVFYNKKATIRGRVYPRYYFNEDELRDICQTMLNESTLKDKDFCSWMFIELKPDFYPELILRIDELDD